MLTIKPQGDEGLIRQIKTLQLPKSKKSIYHRRIGREVIKIARKNIQQQRTVNGQKFAPRKNGKRTKMLRRIAKGSNLKQFANSKRTIVTWPNAYIGKLARAHQEGIEDKYTAARMEKEHGQPDYSAPATSKQAKALIKAGYRLNRGKYKSGKNKGNSKTKRVSQAWIKENMTLGQAGIVLRMLTDNEAEKSWTVKTEARPFFGLTKKHGSTLAHELLNEIINGAKHAR